MLLTISYILVGAIVLSPQQLPGVAIGDVNPLSGKSLVNFRHADLDDNGEQDIVLPHIVYFQDKKSFSSDRKAAISDSLQHPIADVWNSNLYLAFPGSLKIMHREPGIWIMVLEQRMDWQLPTYPESETEVRGTTPANSVLFKSFLYDFEQDNDPEIVFPVEAGLAVYKRESDAFKRVALLDIYPPASVMESTRHRIWPEQVRRLEFPVQRMACRVLVEGQDITVFSQQEINGDQILYRFRRFHLHSSLAVSPETSLESVSPPMPGYMQPCRLNDDAIIDFAGGDWSYATSSVLPTPLYETVASTDEGTVFQRLRTRSYRPRCSFIDFDGDGDLDRIGETTGVFDGGSKETIARLVSSRDLTHTIQIYLQGGTARFSTEADVSATLSIRLDTVLMRSGKMAENYLAGQLIDVTGDFNGDQLKDIVVHDMPNRLAIHFARRSKSSSASVFEFASEPDVTIPVTPGDYFGVADVNADDVSDIEVWGYGGEAAENVSSVLYFTTGVTP